MHDFGTPCTRNLLTEHLNFSPQNKVFLTLKHRSLGKTSWVLNSMGGGARRCLKFNGWWCAEVSKIQWVVMQGGGGGGGRSQNLMTEIPTTEKLMHSR